MRHGRNIVSFYFFLFTCGCAKCLSNKQCVGLSARVDTLCSSCSLQKYLEQWPAALYEAGRSVLMLMKGAKIPRIELSTVHLYQHYSLFMPNKLQYTWLGDYCEWVQPAQLPILTEVRAPSLLEQHPWYIPHRDHAGYNNWLTRNDLLCYRSGWNSVWLFWGPPRSSTEEVGFCWGCWYSNTRGLSEDPEILQVYIHDIKVWPGITVSSDMKIFIFVLFWLQNWLHAW